MSRVSKMLRKSDSRRHRVNPYELPSRRSKVLEDVHEKRSSKATKEKKKEWDDATCSVCMEYPHNAVLLLCSSYDKGCRPYMCATSYRYSNCLEQYKKAYMKVSIDNFDFGSGLGCSDDKTEVSELLCPLCRGQVKGWTVVEPAREYFNKKRRTCTQDNCSFVGSYKELRKHVRAEHPLGRPREVDPTLAKKWERLENERERNDVISTIRTSTPGAIIIGDYVIERNYRGYDVDGALLRLGSYRGGRNNSSISHRLHERDLQSWEDEDFGISSLDNQISRHQNRLFLARSRRGRRRSANGGR